MKTFSLYALVGVDEYVDPAHKHPEGALCATGGYYPPLQSIWEAGFIQQMAQLRQLRAAMSRPYRCGGNREPATTNEVHPLSQPIRAASF